MVFLYDWVPFNQANVHRKFGLKERLTDKHIRVCLPFVEFGPLDQKQYLLTYNGELLLFLVSSTQTKNKATK